MNPVILTVFLGTMTVTSYRSVPQQTDNSPCFTSTGERVNRVGVAISRDLLCGACRKLHNRCARPDNPTKLHYGDLLFIEDVGLKVVNDVMGDTKYNKSTKKRVKIRNAIDVWVERFKDEQAFHRKFGRRKLRVFKISLQDKQLCNTTNRSIIRRIGVASINLMKQVIQIVHEKMFERIQTA